MKLLAAICAATVFISVLLSLFTLDFMSSKFSQCNGRIFSEQCNLVDSGRSIIFGMVVMGLAAILSLISIHVLLSAMSREKGNGWPAFALFFRSKSDL